MSDRIFHNFKLADGSVLQIDDSGGIYQTTKIGQIGPQSPQEPIPASFVSVPNPAPKRKRGRPRKEPSLTIADVVRAQSKLTGEFRIDEQKFENCKYCKRELPVEVIPIHEENCRAAAQGYASHVAQPGKDPGGA